MSSYSSFPASEKVENFHFIMVGDLPIKIRRIMQCFVSPRRQMLTSRGESKDAAAGAATLLSRRMKGYIDKTVDVGTRIVTEYTTTLTGRN